MFGLSIFEIMVIGVLFLIFVKPEELPGTLRKIAFFLGKARRAMNDARDLIDEIKYMDPPSRRDQEPSLADKIAAAGNDLPADNGDPPTETVDTNTPDASDTPVEKSTDEWVRPVPRDQTPPPTTSARDNTTPDK